MSNQDILLSDEELKNTIFATFFRLSGGMNNIATAESEHLLDLINTQKRLYAESVIGEDESHKEWCAANRDTICICGEVVKRELRAEQRAKLTNTKED